MSVRVVRDPETGRVQRIEIEALVGQWERDIEDSGCAEIIHVDPSTTDPGSSASSGSTGIFARIQSWAEDPETEGAHAQFRLLDEAQRIKVTIEVTQWADESIPTEVVGTCCITSEDVVRTYNLGDGEDYHCERCGREAPISWKVAVRPR